MSRRTNRRQFLKTSAAIGAGYWIGNTALGQDNSNSPNERIRFACFGVGGQGGADSQGVAKLGDVVAICDVDQNRLDQAGAERFPKARKFTDFRKLLDEMDGSIDAVTVSTPDHTHAVIAVRAMSMGKHCYCQKPLARTIYETRVMAETARKYKVATQMGNQGTAADDLRKAAAMLRAGVVGDIEHIHVWTNRPVWPQGMERPPASEPPATLNWDLWLGPAPERPYASTHINSDRPAYHPFSWRGWWDFGTGALGDMACHTMNMTYMGLRHVDPVTVEAEHSGHNKDSFPTWAKITWQFPEREGRKALGLTWYEGGKKPDTELFQGAKIESSGVLVIGSKATMYVPGDYVKNYQFLGDVDEPEVDFPRSPGHYEEFARAIRGGEPAMSNFPDYAAGLTEMALLGNLAVWSDKKIEWDAKNMRATNAPELDELIKPRYRDGWSLT